MDILISAQTNSYFHMSFLDSMYSGKSGGRGIEAEMRAPTPG